MGELDPLLTPDQTAALLGTSKKTLEGWRRTGHPLPHLRLSPKMVRYREKDVVRFLDECMRTNTRGGRPEGATT